MSLPSPVFNSMTASTATISGGTIDSTVIGGTTPASLNGLITSTGSNTARSLANRFTDTINVLDYGADPTGVTDSAPAFRSALGSNRKIIISSGTYLLNSSQTAPYTAFDPPAVLVQSFTNFAIEGYGATIIIGNSIALSSAFHFDKCNNFSLNGITIQGNKTGLTSGQENTALAFTSIVNFKIRDIHTTSGFGGVGAPIVGDWWVNGVFENFVSDTAGIGIDCAYIKHVTFRNVKMIGADYTGTSGNANIGTTGFSVIVDPVNSGNNFTGVSYTETDDVHVENCEFSFFTEGGSITTGTNYTFSGNNWHDNPGRSGANSIGLLISYASNSTGVPVTNVLISDTFENNGVTQAGTALYFNGSVISNSDVISGIIVTNCKFLNNASTAIDANAVTGYLTQFSGIQIYSNLYSGTSQTTNVSVNVAALTAANTSQITTSSNVLSLTGGNLTGGLSITGSNLLITPSSLGATAPTSLTTIADAPSGNVLTFTSTTGVIAGMTARATGIPLNTLVTSVTPTTVTLTNTLVVDIPASSVINFIFVALSLDLSGTNANLSNLLTYDYRYAAGANWTTATRRVGLIIDSTDEGFLEFNPNGFGGGLGLGAGTPWSPTYGMTMTSSGAINFPVSASAPTMAAGNSSSNLATTAFVANSFAPKSTPTFTGTASFNNTMVVSGILYINSNGAGIPAQGTAGSLTWNYTAGAGEVDFWNLHSAPTTSFTWYQVTSGAAVSLMSLLPTGILQFPSTAQAKINLYGTNYGIGIASNNFQLWSNGNWSFNTSAFGGAAVASISASGIMQVGGFATRVVTASGAITALSSDCVIIVNKTTGAASAITLLASPTTGQMVTIKDGKGDAATNNITITPASGTIDGSSTAVLNTNFASATLIYSGAFWSIV